MKKKNLQVTIIKPASSLDILDISEVLRFKDLLYIFVWRNLKVHYKQTILGVLWVIFQPLVSTGIFSIFFGKIAQMQSDNLPYPLFVFSGLILWFFFSNSLSAISDVMVSEQNLIKKVYFPKIILPIAILLTNSIDFAINLAVFILFALLQGYFPNSMFIVFLLVGIFLTSVSALGLGLFLMSLNVKYRDVRYILPFFIQLLLFLTPVIYPLSIVGGMNKFILALNPVTSSIMILRASIDDSSLMQPELIIISLLSSLIILAIGIFYFHKTEKYFADIL